MKEAGSDAEDPQPQDCKDFEKLLKPIFTKLAAECQRFENRPLRLKHNKRMLDLSSKLLLYARSREAAANDLKLENQRLRAQVVALQGVLTPKVATAKATTERATSAQQIPEDEREPKEATQ
jgi:hypothetical protein